MHNADVKSILKQRLDEVERRIRNACDRCGRNRDDVRLIAVTKTVTADVARLFPDLGVVDLGESRPQELWRKAEQLPDSVRWHQIGHLQRNKVERTLPLVHLIHSVDSWRLLNAVEREAAKMNRRVEVLLEVNAGGETQKHGFAPDEMHDLQSQLESCRFARVRGLMTMAPFEADPENCRPSFVKLRTLREELAATMPGEHMMEHLSMGMTNDFEIAIEEGSTMVRLGTVLFEGLSE